MIIAVGPLETALSTEAGRDQMASVCEVCGKTPSFGNKVSRVGKDAIKRRIKGKSPRMFKPNIQRVRAVVDGQARRVHICTSCIKAGRVTKRFV
jgi:large subunit ribosomal protein L28